MLIKKTLSFKKQQNKAKYCMNKKNNSQNLISSNYNIKNSQSFNINNNNYNFNNNNNKNYNMHNKSLYLIKLK